MKLPSLGARLALVIPAGLAVPLLMTATRNGIGLSHDSAIFLWAARSLRAGQGFTFPSPVGYLHISHFPPLFPAALAWLGGRSGDLMEFVRWFHLALISANTFLITALAFL